MVQENIIKDYKILLQDIVESFALNFSNLNDRDWSALNK